MPRLAPCRCLTVIGVAGLVVLDGCLSKPLDKKEAAQIVRESAAFTRPKFAHIPRLLTFQGYFSSPYGTEGVLSIAQLAQIDPTVAILKIGRLISVSESIYGPGRGAMHHLVITPTSIDSASLLADEGRGAYDAQETIDAQEERPPTSVYGWNRVQREPGWRVPIGTRELLQVDQIHNWKDANENIPVNELAIDFSWRWTPNDFGDAFDSQSESFTALPDSVQESARLFGARMNTAEPMHSRAFLHREGVKWQLRLIQWSYGRGNPR
jgi:hypothetical protein